MISNDTKSDSIKHIEINIEELENKIYEKFNLTDLKEKSDDIPFYSKLLHYYSCVIDAAKLASNIDSSKLESIYYWSAVLFRGLHRSGTESTSFEDAKETLEMLDKHLALRSTIINYEISWIDIIAISALRQNSSVWSSLVRINFEGFQNIKRLIDWIEGLSEVFWDSICKVSKNPKTKIKKNSKVNPIGSTEIIEAVKSGNKALVRSILESNPFAIGSVDVKFKNYSLAHIACKNKDLEMMKLLVEFKVNIEAEEKQKMTPIYFAADQDDQEMLDYLIEIGANVNHLDTRNRTPVYYVTEISKPSIIKTLLIAGCDPSIKGKSGKSAISKACWAGNHEVAKYLLETEKVNFNEPDQVGRTWLHNAVWGWSKLRENEKEGEENPDSLEVVRLLLEYGADPNFKDKAGWTPLSLACLNFREKWIKLLISYGADLNLTNNNGETSFLCAVHKGYYECWLLLYEYPDVNPYCKNIHGYDALELAIAFGKSRLINWVIKEKIENNKEYPGFEISKHDSKVLLLHTVNNPKNYEENIKAIIDFMYTYQYEELLYILIK